MTPGVHPKFFADRAELVAPAIRLRRCCNVPTGTVGQDGILRGVWQPRWAVTITCRIPQLQRLYRFRENALIAIQRALSPLSIMRRSRTAYLWNLRTPLQGAVIWA